METTFPLLTAAGRRRKLRGTRNLLDDWASAYRHSLRPRHLIEAPDRAHPAETLPTLIYADLLAAGSERCIAAAETLYAAHLARFFE